MSSYSIKPSLSKSVNANQASVLHLFTFLKKGRIKNVLKQRQEVDQTLDRTTLTRRSAQQFLFHRASLTRTSVVKSWPFPETPNCYWLLRLLWHLWKLYGQQSLQLVTFWIPFKAKNTTAFWDSKRKRQLLVSSDHMKESWWESGLTVSSWRKRSLIWWILMEAEGLVRFKKGLH